MIYIYLANGFEETEMIAPLDIIRRAGLEVKTVSITNENVVFGSHSIGIKADMTVFDPEYDEKNADMIILPGGLPGTTNLEKSTKVNEALDYAYANDKFICAICAAPSVLGKKGFLKGRKAVSYPGFEEYLLGAEYSDARCQRDGKIITAVGMGAAVEFGLEIVAALCGKETSEKIKNGILA